MTSPEKLATPEITLFNNWFVSDAAHAPAQPDEPSDFPARLAQRAWLAAKSAVLATQRQGEGETRDAALEQAANLVECEYAADATQGRRLAQIAQHIRDLKNRKPL